MRVAIRQKLAPPPRQFTTPIQASRSDFDLNPEARAEFQGRGPVRNAAVLIPIIDRREAMTVLFTRRTEHLTNHAGQVSFPGGRAEDHDEGPVATALRETEEEIGLDRSYVDVVGALGGYETVTSFVITPVVGVVTPGFDLKIDANEVAEVFEVPLDFLFDPANREIGSRIWNGKPRQYYQFTYDGHRIWGATARMVVILSEAMRDAA
jgi:8-oxo-dGTP pyrophosphatase MutT (NUDIX family)